MSKGLSTIQKTIIGLMDGTQKRQRYNYCDEMMTSEILEELDALGLVDAGKRKAAMFTIWRACDSLFRRKMLTAKYHRNEHNDKEISWKIVPVGK